MIKKGFIAAGTIYPSRFVKLAGTFLDSKLAQCGSGDSVFGISQEFAQDAPIPSNTTGDAAASGEQLAVYTVDDVCPLELGSGGATAGQYLKPDSDGKGVATALGTTTDYGAIAPENGAEGELVRVAVRIGR